MGIFERVGWFFNWFAEKDVAGECELRAWMESNPEDVVGYIRCLEDKLVRSYGGF